MITGKLTFDVEVSADSEQKLQELSSSIEKKVKELEAGGVISCELVDLDIQEDEE